MEFLDAGSDFPQLFQAIIELGEALGFDLSSLFDSGDGNRERGYKFEGA